MGWQDESWHSQDSVMITKQLKDLKMNWKYFFFLKLCASYQVYECMRNCILYLILYITPITQSTKWVNDNEQDN